MRKVDEAAAAQAQVGRRSAGRARLAGPSEGARRRRWRATTLTCLLSVAACSGGDRRGDERDAAPNADRAAAPVAYKQVVVGNTQACALREDGSVECWGATEEEIEIGTTDIYYHEGVAPDGLFERLDISGVSRTGQPVNSASGRACAIERGSSTICCWGRANFGRNGNKTCAQMLAAFEHDPFTEVVNGETQVCGLTTSGELRCRDDHGTEHIVTGVLDIAGSGYSVFAYYEDGLFEDAILSGGGDCRTVDTLGDSATSIPKGLTNPSLVDGSPSCLWQSEPGIIRCADSRGDWDPGSGMVDAVGRGTTTCAIYESGEVRCETPHYDYSDSDYTSDWPDDPVGQFKQIALWPDNASVGCGVTLDGQISCWGSPSGQARRIVSDAP